MDLERDFVIVPASLNGIAAPMVVDTAAERSLVTAAAAQRFQLPADRETVAVIDDQAGRMAADMAVVERLGIGALDVKPGSVVVTHIARLTGGGPQPAGVIGADVLSRFDIDLDFPARRLSLYRVRGCAGDFVPWAARHFRVNATRSSRNLVFATVKIDATSVDALVDTGAFLSRIDIAMARRAGATDDQFGQDPEVSGRGVGGLGFAGRLHRFGEIRVGPEQVRGPAILVTEAALEDAPMILGLDFLASQRIWISNATGQLFIAPLQSAADRNPAAMPR